MEIADLKKRFFAKISGGPGECIDWVGARRPKGCGLLSVDNVLRCATHVSWFLKYGVWPTFKLLHTCDRPPCVNPEHLFEGTDQDNANDRDAKGRGARKLDWLEVSELVALTDTRMSIAEIGELFGVSPSYVSKLRHGRSRKNLRSRKSDKPMACTTVEVSGVTMTIKEAAKATGLTYDTLNRRRARGMTGSDLIARPHEAPRKLYQRTV